MTERICHPLVVEDAVIRLPADRYLKCVEADAAFYAAKYESAEAEREAAVKAAVEAERSGERAQRTKRRRFIKDMEKLGYEVTGFEPDDKFALRKVKTWQDETADRDSNGALSATSGLSHGPSKAAHASAARARRAAKKLKSSSATGSKPEGEGEAGLVIPLKCS